MISANPVSSAEPAGSAQAYSYVSFRIAGSYSVSVAALNDSGAVAGNYQSSANPYSTGFMYAHGALKIVQPPGSKVTFVTGIDAEGTVYGYYRPGGTQRYDAFSFAGGMYTIVGQAGLSTTFKYASRDGTVVGSTKAIYGTAPGTTFLYRDSHFGPALALPGYVTVTANNDYGTVVGYAQRPVGGAIGFMLQHDVYTALPRLPQGVLFPYGINDAGTIVGEVNVGNGNGIAFILKNGETQTFKYPGAYATFFVGIDRAGDAAGGAQGTHIQGPAFVMTNGKFINIAPPGSTATFMEAINDNGQVSGVFYPSDNSGLSVFIGTPQ